MSLHRRNPKRDANERAIIDALEAVHARVWQLSGKGCPDLLVLWQGRYHPLEVKSKAGKTTAAQADIPWPIVRNVEDALGWVGVTREAAKRWP